MTIKNLLKAIYLLGLVFKYGQENGQETIVCNGLKLSFDKGKLSSVGGPGFLVGVLKNHFPGVLYIEPDE